MDHEVCTAVVHSGSLLYVVSVMSWPACSHLGSRDDVRGAREVLALSITKAHGNALEIAYKTDAKRFLADNRAFIVMKRLPSSGAAATAFACSFEA